MKLTVRTSEGLTEVEPWAYFRTTEEGTVSGNLIPLLEPELARDQTVTGETLRQIQGFWQGLAKDVHLRMLYREQTGTGTGLELVTGGWEPQEERE